MSVEALVRLIASPVSVCSFWLCTFLRFCSIDLMCMHEKNFFSFFYAIAIPFGNKFFSLKDNFPTGGFHRIMTSNMNRL